MGSGKKWNWVFSIHNGWCAACGELLRNTGAYPSNLTHAQYEFLSDMIPDPKPGGRKRKVDMWFVLNAIFYVRSSGSDAPKLDRVLILN